MSRRADAINAVAARLHAIDDMLKIVTSIGNPVSEIDKKNRFLVEGQYYAFEVTCEGSNGRDAEAAACERTYAVMAYGYFGFANDGSKEAAVQTLCEQIEDAFDPISQRTFDGQFANSDPVEIQGPKVVALAGVLVYGVIVTCKVKDYPRY